jgi:hypothetical protein
VLDTDTVVALIVAAQDIATGQYATLRPEDLPIRKEAEKFLRAMWRNAAPPSDDD